MKETCCPSCKKKLNCCEDYNDQYKIYMIRKIVESGDNMTNNGNYPLGLYKETGVIKDDN